MFILIGVNSGKEYFRSPSEPAIHRWLNETYRQRTKTGASKQLLTFREPVLPEPIRKVYEIIKNGERIRKVVTFI